MEDASMFKNHKSRSDSIYKLGGASMRKKLSKVIVVTAIIPQKHKRYLKLQGHEANLSTLVLYNDGTNNL
jgi:hypothetical protein